MVNALRQSFVNRVCQAFTHFNAPLIERINIPDDALTEHFVFVNREQCAKFKWPKSFHDNGCRRSVARQISMWFRFVLETNGHRLALRERIGGKPLMMLGLIVVVLCDQDEIGGKGAGAFAFVLSTQLLGRMKCK